MDDVVPIQALLVSEAPIRTMTHAAQLVNPYTKPKGMYLTVVQHARSTLRAQRRTIML